MVFGYVCVSAFELNNDKGWGKMMTLLTPYSFTLLYLPPPAIHDISGSS